MRWWQRQSLGSRLVLGIGLALLLTLGVSFLGISGYIRARLWEREVHSAENLNVMAATLLGDAMMEGRESQVQAALERLGQSMRGQIEDIAIYDDQAVLTSFASGFPEGRSIQQSSLEVGLGAPGCGDCHDLPSGERPNTALVSLEGEEILRSVMPLYNEPRCQTCHGTERDVLGKSILDHSLDDYRRASSAVTVGLSGGLMLAVVVAVSIVYWLLRRIVLSPLGELAGVAQAVVEGDMDRQVRMGGEDEMGRVGVAFNAMTARQRELIGTLEHRVAERTDELERRSAYLEASAEVGRAAASILDADQLIRQVVELIRDRFGLYYVGLFLLDETREWAVLRAGTGEAGRIMLARGHRLRVGEGMIGWSVSFAQPRVAMEVGEDAVRQPTAELPSTRSEAAIPLRSRGQVLGALTVQSDQPAAFDADTVAVLLALADQVAVALDNARLLAASQTALEAERRAYGEIGREAWAELTRARPELSLISDSQGTRPAVGPWQPEMVQVVRTGQAIEDDARLIALPVKVRGEAVGVVRLVKAEGASAWTKDEVTLMETLIEQMSVALEGARAYQSTLGSAAREQLVGEITSRMRETLDVDVVLQTAVREIRQAMKLHDITIRLGNGRELEQARRGEETQS